MLQYGNKIIAEAGHYITDGRAKAMALPYSPDAQYTEHPLTDTVKHLIGDTYNVGDAFAIRLTATTKKDLVSILFSNDDQIAIILNRENGEEEEQVYQFMQRWRNWFSTIIQRMRAV